MFAREMTAEQVAACAPGFWARVDCSSDRACWLWQGHVNAQGYGVYNTTLVGMVPLYAHRISYALTNGHIPEGLTVDHLCRIPLCVNPSHLELVTADENVRRANAARARATCPRGHVYDYVIIRPNGTLNRQCRECRRIASREFSQRNRLRRNHMRRTGEYLPPRDRDNVMVADRRAATEPQPLDRRGTAPTPEQRHTMLAAIYGGTE